MPARVLILAAAIFSCLLRPAMAEEPITPDQIIERYRHAIGADQFPSITTFIERGEIQSTITDPNISNLGRLAVPKAMFQHQRYETYFKLPNLRFNTLIAESNQLIDAHGCDGKVSWHIDLFLNRKEKIPKPGQEDACESGFRSSLLLEYDGHAGLRLVGQKKIQDRMAWEIKVEKVAEKWPDTYYFDTETYLLLRYARRDRSVTLSDYRDVSGIKRPFTVVRHDSIATATITVREIQVNVPIDDSRFVQPQPANGSVALNPVLPPTPAAPTTTAAATAAPTAAVPSAQPAPAPASTAPATQINYPNFTTCTLAELQSWFPELRRLKPAADQAELQPLLEKIGARLRDTAHNTPNLISSEAVTNSVPGVADKHRDYDYLIVPRMGDGEIYLNEFRVDVKTGAQFQVDDLKSASTGPAQSAPVQAAPPGQPPAPSESGWQPLSQGFASSWVYLFPRNQAQSTFRYLGEQKLDGRRSVVLAFAQMPKAVTSPGLFRYQGRSIPMYFQGVAWFDPSDFRILRLRTELLSPLPEVSLQKLSADIQFAETRIAGVSTVLFLPRDVDVASVVSGGTLREHHSYSKYRLFRAQSKIVVNQ